MTRLVAVRPRIKIGAQKSVYAKWSFVDDIYTYRLLRNFLCLRRYAEQAYTKTKNKQTNERHISFSVANFERDCLYLFFCDKHTYMDTIRTLSEEDTVKAAKTFARTINTPCIICLHGDLGMGKSVFARALIRTLCDDQGIEVPSPTYTLVQTYDSNAGPVFHYDLYRLKDSEEIYEIGWEDSLVEGVTIVEWPERLGELLPDSRVDVRIFPVENAPDSRIIEIIDNTK